MSMLPPNYNYGYGGVLLDEPEEDTFLQDFAKEIAELMVRTGNELQKLHNEPDESFRERLERDLKAGAWDQIEKIVEKLI